MLFSSQHDNKLKTQVDLENAVQKEEKKLRKVLRRKRKKLRQLRKEVRSLRELVLGFDNDHDSNMESAETTSS